MEINYSTIAKMAKCPRSYELDLMGTEPAPLGVPLYLGGTFHLAQRIYFSSKMAGLELSVDKVVETFDVFWYSMEAARGQPIFWGREKPEDQAELGRAMVKAFYPYAQKMQPLLVEQKLTRDTPHGLVYGTIDLLTAAGSVVDYKTSAKFPWQNDINEELQPTVYSFLLGGTVPFIYYYIMKFKYPVVRIYSTKRSAEEIKFFENVILPEVVSMIQAGVFPPLGAANGSCRWCAHKEYCGDLR